MTDKCFMCGGEFTIQKVWIDGAPSHPGCSIMSHPPHTAEAMANMHDSLQTEIERLQNTLKLHAGDCQSLSGEVTMFKERAEAAEADNERLRALLRVLLTDTISAESRELREAKTGIARLRAALREIAAYPHSEEGGEIARAALETKS